jgi:hypothetical protein
VGIRIALVAALAALTIASSARAATFTGPRAQWMTWLEAASREPGPDGAILLRSGSCPGTEALGCADVDGGELWLAIGSKFVAMHELGHFFDARNLDADERAELQFLMGVRMDEPWQNPKVFGADCGYNQCPSEMFADAYANCALGRSFTGRRVSKGHYRGGWESPYGYLPRSNRWYRAMCATISAAA